MATIGQGGIATFLDARFSDGTGAAVTPVNPLIDIIDALGIELETNVVPEVIALGHYQYPLPGYAVPGAGAIGTWRAHWTGTINGVAISADDYFTVVAAGTIIPGADSSSPPCQPWCEIEDLPCFAEEADEALMARMIDAASSNLYELSNRKFPGICEKTVLACTRRSLRQAWRRNDLGDYVPTAACGCHRTEECNCSTLSAIRLPQIIGVSWITIDGETVAPETYRVDGGMEIVRLDEDWPCCDDILIRYTTGAAPPPDGVLAAQILACEFILAFNPDTTGRCRLPKGVTQVVRNGINITIKPADVMSLFEVSTFIEAHNPRKLRGGPAMVLTPDVPRLARRIG